MFPNLGTLEARKFSVCIGISFVYFRLLKGILSLYLLGASGTVVVGETKIFPDVSRCALEDKIVLYDAKPVKLDVVDGLLPWRKCLLLFFNNELCFFKKF